MRHSGLTYHSARCALNVDIFQQINKLRVSPDASFRSWEGREPLLSISGRLHESGIAAVTLRLYVSLNFVLFCEKRINQSGNKHIGWEILKYFS